MKPWRAMLRSRKRVVALALVAAIAAVAWFKRPPPEPEYQGKRLSTWMWEANSGGPELTAADLETLGPAAVSWLAYTVEHGWRAYDERGWSAIRTGPEWLRRFVPEALGGSWGTSAEARSAIAALARLGPSARAAIPALARTVHNEDLDLASESAFALHAMGPDSWPAVLKLMDTGSRWGRYSLVEGISMRLWHRRNPLTPHPTDSKLPREATVTATDVANSRQVLRKGFRDVDPSVRVAAITTVFSCEFFAGDFSDRTWPRYFRETLPTLIELLADASPRVRFAAAQVVGFFGVEAAAATPRLIELLEDESSMIRREAACSLGGVDRVEKRSVGALRKMLADPDLRCRYAAREILAGFETSATETGDP